MTFKKMVQPKVYDVVFPAFHLPSVRPSNEMPSQDLLTRRKVNIRSRL